MFYLPIQMIQLEIYFDIFDNKSYKKALYYHLYGF
jgi:hypothetical protein